MKPVRNALSGCAECGLLQRVPELASGNHAHCQRCNAALRRAKGPPSEVPFALSLLGLTLFALAFLFPIATVTMPSGRFATMSLTSGVASLSDAGVGIVAFIVIVTLLLLPAHKFIATLCMLLGVWRGKVPSWVKSNYRAVSAIAEWAMVDVFLLGALVSLTRLGVWMNVEPGLALLALAGTAACAWLLERALDPRDLWRNVPLTGCTADSARSDSICCQACKLITGAAEGSRCPRCDGKLRPRKRSSIQRTWALASAATLLLIPANILPVMTITRFGAARPSTIMGGTVELIERGFWSLAVIVFVASVLIPVLKLVLLAVLLLTTSHGWTARLGVRTTCYRVVAKIGRWSMLDIFATMVLVALARFGWVGNVQPGAGATAFCAVVLLTMLASRAFDPRLMWDAAGRNATASAAVPSKGWVMA